MEQLTATNIASNREGELSMNTLFTNSRDTSDAVMHVISELLSEWNTSLPPNYCLNGIVSSHELCVQREVLMSAVMNCVCRERCCQQS